MPVQHPHACERATALFPLALPHFVLADAIFLPPTVLIIFTSIYLASSGVQSSDEQAKLNVIAFSLRRVVEEAAYLLPVAAEAEPQSRCSPEHQLLPTVLALAPCLAVQLQKPKVRQWVPSQRSLAEEQL